MTIADMNAFTYASTHFWAMVNVDGLDALQAWMDGLMKRESVQKGLQIPFFASRVLRPALCYGRGDC